MDYLYFDCNWLMYPIDISILRQTLDTAQNLNCEIVGGAELRKSDEGYIAISLFVRVPSEAVLETFIKSILLENLKKYRQITAEEFEQGTNFYQQQGTFHPIPGFLEFSRVVGSGNLK